MKLLIHSQTSTVAPMKFGNGYVISSRTLLGMWLLIHDFLFSPRQDISSERYLHVSSQTYRAKRVHWFILYYTSYDDVIKWKHFPRCWPLVWGIHQSPVNSPHKGQWHRALIFSLICVWINGWVNNGESGDLRRHRAHYDVIVMAIIPEKYHSIP